MRLKFLEIFFVALLHLLIVASRIPNAEVMHLHLVNSFKLRLDFCLVYVALPVLLVHKLLHLELLLIHVALHLLLIYNDLYFYLVILRRIAI